MLSWDRPSSLARLLGAGFTINNFASLAVSRYPSFARQPLVQGQRSLPSNKKVNNKKNHVKL